MGLADLSRAVSHALRHEPWLYELEPDDEGWVAVEELLQALRQERAEWASLAEADLARMIERSDKQRHELRDGKIRAIYGHSFPGKLLKEAAEPPGLLYHGTSPQAAHLIRREGLRRMSRHYVHLSVDTETARRVGARKARFPVVLTVQARDAYEHGIRFYRGNDLVWLADEVPPTFIAAS